MRDPCSQRTDPDRVAVLTFPFLILLVYLGRRTTHVDRQWGPGMSWASLAVAIVLIGFLTGLPGALGAALTGALLGWSTGRTGWPRIAFLCAAALLIIVYGCLFIVAVLEWRGSVLVAH